MQPARRAASPEITRIPGPTPARVQRVARGRACGLLHAVHGPRRAWIVDRVCRYDAPMKRALFGTLLLLALSGTLDTPPAQGQMRPVALSALGRCLDVAYANAFNGAAVQLWDCNGTPAQQWYLEGNRIRSALGRCLDVTAGNPGNGARVQTYDCNGTPAQQWTFMPNGALRNGIGTCLDVSSANSGNGAAIQAYQCNGTPAQAWSAR